MILKRIEKLVPDSEYVSCQLLRLYTMKAGNDRFFDDPETLEKKKKYGKILGIEHVSDFHYCDRFKENAKR